MSFEPVTPSQAEQHRAWKEARVRLRAPETVQKPSPGLSIVPIVHDPVRELMDFVVAAVGNVAGLPVNEIIAGPPTMEVRKARNLALGICAARLKLEYRLITDHFEVQEGAIRYSEKALTKILSDFTISNKTPLERCLPTIWGEWGKESNNPTIGMVLEAVCRRWEVSRHDVCSHRRTWNITVPRHAAFALAKRLTLRSLPEIGRRLGGKDHTTVLHGTRRFAPIIKELNKRMLPAATVSEWADAAFEEHKVTPMASPERIRKGV